MKKNFKNKIVLVTLLIIGLGGFLGYKIFQTMDKGEYLLFSQFERIENADGLETCTQVLYRVKNEIPVVTESFYSNKADRCKSFFVADKRLFESGEGLYSTEITLGGARVDETLSDSLGGSPLQSPGGYSVTSDFIDGGLQNDLLISVFDGKGEKVAEKIVARSLIAQPMYLAPFAMSADGRQVYLQSFSEASFSVPALWIYDWRADTFKESEVVREEKIEITDINVTAKKAIGISEVQNSHLYLIDLETGEAKRLLSSQNGPFVIAGLSPGGERIIWKSSSDERSYYQNIDARETIDGFTGRFITWIDEENVVVEREGAYFLRDLMKGSEVKIDIAIPEAGGIEYIGKVSN